MALPEKNTSIELTYLGKTIEKDILVTIATSFIKVEQPSKKVSIAPNSFVLADNLLALHNLIENKQKATLVYLDPPYGTGKQFQSRQLQPAYQDNMNPVAYLEFMRRRLILIREIISDDGSIYIHIGHQMLFHLKIILDEIFGGKNFRNIIVRKKCSSKNYTSKQYANLNDYILFYTKSAKYKWHKPGMIPDKNWIEKEYPKSDSKGKYKLVPIHAPGTRNGATGKPWQGMNPPPGKHWQYTPAKLDELDKKGEIYWSKNGNPRRKVYLDKNKTISLTDYWDKFRDAHHQSIKITGYPTEKNFEMLKMIVAASSNEGDLVIDPFCGSGTTIHAANELGRKWIGIDNSFEAAKATLKRLRYGLESMGDYVNNNNKLKDLQLSDRSSHSDTLAKFDFLVESWLMKDFKAEITEISNI